MKVFNTIQACKVEATTGEDGLSRNDMMHNNLVDVVSGSVQKLEGNVNGFKRNLQALSDVNESTLKGLKDKLSLSDVMTLINDLNIEERLSSISSESHVMLDAKLKEYVTRDELGDMNNIMIRLGDLETKDVGPTAELQRSNQTLKQSLAGVLLQIDEIKDKQQVKEGTLKAEIDKLGAIVTSLANGSNSNFKLILAEFVRGIVNEEIGGNSAKTEGGVTSVLNSVLAWALKIIFFIPNYVANTLFPISAAARTTQAVRDTGKREEVVSTNGNWWLNKTVFVCITTLEIYLLGCFAFGLPLLRCCSNIFAVKSAVCGIFTKP